MAEVVKTETKAAQAAEALVRRLDPQALIAQAIQNNSGVETLERLFALAKDVRAEQAREAYNQAMAVFQKDPPKIIKSKRGEVSGRFSYTYAPLEGIMTAILPILGPLGLSVSWRNKFEPGRVISNCRISHDLGHFEESGEISVPVSEDKMGASGAQRIGIALTYSKRYSLLSLIGIAPEDDPDAQPEPTPMPRRASEQSQSQPPRETEWTGTITRVISKAGETNGKKWSLFILVGSDGTEFSTFDDKDAEFARQAGKAPVSILWEATAKGKKVLSLQPATEPGEQG